MKKTTRRFTPVIILFLVGGICILMFPHNIPLIAGHASGKSEVELSPALKEIISYGSSAPNSHNAQMWKIKVPSDQSLILAFDSAHLIPQVDPDNREALISLGAFLENMVSIAPKYDLQANVEIIAETNKDEEVALVSFTETTDEAAKNGALLKEELIKQRHTIRKPFEKRPLTTEDLSSLRSVDAYGHLIYFPLASTEGTYIAHALVDSMAKQVASDEKQKEFADYTRLSRKEANEKQDGITPAMMGLSGIKKWFVSTFFSKKTIMSSSFRQQTVDTVKNQASNSAGFLLICSTDQTVTSLVNTGRLLQKVWLQATANQIAVHPMSSVLEESPWREEINTELGIDQRIQMILRLGYVDDYGEPISKRRTVPILPK